MTAIAEVDLGEITELEQRRRLRTRPGRPGRSGLWSRRRWIAFLAVLVGWSCWDAIAGRSVINPGGFVLVRRFVAAAWRPEVDPSFLVVVVDAAATTVAYALVGTAVALVIGLIGGVLCSETWWRRDPLEVGRRHGGRRRRRTRIGWVASRVVAAVPRGVHEAIWALILLYVLGRNPLVAVLGIGIPFGAVTAKVVAEIIDDAAAEPFLALRAAGAGRLTALAYGVAPVVGGEIVSYAFYRLECSLRSSVVLGVIGAGGLGFQLALSFQSLRYEEIWTIIYVLVLLSVLADWWGASLRHRPSRRQVGASAIVAAVLTLVAAWRLGLRPATLVDERARRLAGELADSAWPPELPDGGWATLWSAAVDTVQLSVIAIAIAATLAVPCAFIAARRAGTSPLGRLGAGVVRTIVVFLRAIPPPVWALVVLFVVFPGPLAGGIALGVYTLGVLARLDAEVVEQADPMPSRVLAAAGAPASTAVAYGTIPLVAPRFVALGLYRWEVAMRETVIVGLVGAGGLGRLLAQQSAAFDESAMLTTVATLVVLALAVDLISARVRAAVR